MKLLRTLFFFPIWIISIPLDVWIWNSIITKAGYDRITFEESVADSWKQYKNIIKNGLFN